jgi:hypothetical protein
VATSFLEQWARVRHQICRVHEVRLAVLYALHSQFTLCSVWNFAAWIQRHPCVGNRRWAQVVGDKWKSEGARNMLGVITTFLL